MNYPSNNGNNQNAYPFDYSSDLRPVAALGTEARLNFIRKTYCLFLAGILMSIVAGTVCLTVPPVFALAMGLLKVPLLLLLLMVGLSFGAQAVSRVEGLNYAALFGFTGFIGFIFAPILALYGRDLVTQAGILTTLAFGGLTAYAFVSRKDFSYLGGMLFVGLIALIGGGVLNLLLFHSLSLSYWMAWVTVVLFAGFVLYDTSQIIHRYDEKGYVSAALSLFLDFLNMFLAILRILGGRR